MAEQLNGEGNGKGKGRGKGARKKSASSKKADNPGMGHNIAEIRKKAEQGIQAILKDFADMESDNGAWRAQIKDKYEKVSNSVGCSRKILRQIVADIRYEQKKEERDESLEAEEREQIDTLCGALQGTPFGVYFAEKRAAT